MFSYNPTTFPLKLKVTPKTFLTVAGNSSSVCPASLLMASASLFSHFFKVLSSFGGKDQETTELPPKTPLIARETIVIERIVSTDIVVICPPNMSTNYVHQRCILIKNLFNGLSYPCKIRLKI